MLIFNTAVSLVEGSVCLPLGCSAANAPAPGEEGEARVGYGEQALEIAATATVAKWFGAAAGVVGKELGAGASAPAKAIATEASGGGAKTSDFVNPKNLEHATGRTASVRNKWIKETIRRDIPNLRMTHIPQYNPFLKGFGVAQKGAGSQIAPRAFSSQRQLVETIVHEELHHRWWAREIYDHHIGPRDIKFESTVQRYMRWRGF